MGRKNHLGISPADILKKKYSLYPDTVIPLPVQAEQKFGIQIASGTFQR
jgi:hypothetical protein